jgi:hypothetical protein
MPGEKRKVSAHHQIWQPHSKHKKNAIAAKIQQSQSDIIF